MCIRDRCAIEKETENVGKDGVEYGKNAGTIVQHPAEDFTASLINFEETISAAENGRTYAARDTANTTFVEQDEEDDEKEEDTEKAPLLQPISTTCPNPEIAANPN